MVAVLVAAASVPVPTGPTQGQAVGDLSEVLRPLFTPSETTRNAFLLIVMVVVLERIFEIWLSRRNAARVRARGGVEAGAGHYPVMVLLHLSFFVALVAEVLLLRTNPIPVLTLISLLIVCGSMVLRYWAILWLKDRWNTRVLYEPGVAPVDRGPYRFLRHPNYVAVVLEILFLPLIHGAWRTAIVFTVANAFLLRHRIRVENEALYGSGSQSRSEAGPLKTGSAAVGPAKTAGDTKLS